MSAYPKNASLLGIIILAMASISVVSAQTPVTVNNLTVKPESIRETKETLGEKNSVPLDEGTDISAAPGVSDANPGSEVSDPVKASAYTNMAIRVAEEKRRGTAVAAPTSPQTASTDSWQFQLTPYLWIPTISGRAGIGNLVTDTSASVGDSNIELNFGLMATFEARKNKFIILTDLQYSDLSTEKGNPGPLFSSSRASFKTFVLDPEIGYRILDNDKGAFVDVLGGIRYWNLDATLAFSAGVLPAVEVTRSRSWIDGVVGLRGKAALSERWFVTGKADLGGGGSNFTYQLFGGVGVNLGKRFALIGGYRDLNVNYNKDGFLFDMSLHGPIFGFGMKF